MKTDDGFIICENKERKMPAHKPTFDECYDTLKAIIEDSLRHLGMVVVSLAIGDEENGTMVQIGAIIPRQEREQPCQVPKVFG